MKRSILAVILVIGAFFCVNAQNTGPIDVVLLLNTSTDMSSSYDNVNNYITGQFLSEFLRVGDTFHLITFSGNPRLDVARRISEVGDVETIIGRILLQYPVENGNNIGSAISFAEQYASTLPERPKKIILVSTVTSDAASLVNSANQRLNSRNITLDFVQVNPGQALTNLPSSGRTPRPSSGASAAQGAAGGTGTATAASAATGTAAAATTSTAATTTPSTTAATTTTTPSTTTTATTTPSTTTTTTTSSTTAADSSASTSTATPAATTTTTTTTTSDTSTSAGQTQDTTSTAAADSTGTGSSVATSTAAAQTRQSASRSSGGFSIASSLPMIIGIIILLLLLLALIIFLASRRLGKSPNRVMAEVSSSTTAPAAKTTTTAKTTTKADDRFADHSKDLASYAAAASKQRTTPYADRPIKTDSAKPAVINPTGPLLLNLFVEDQNTAIGKRNIHSLKSGYSLSVGGANSDFLIFLVPVPAGIGELRRNGSQLTFIPKKPKYFPDLGSNELRDCLNKTIRIISDKNYEMRFRFEMYEDPLVALNRMLVSVRVPG